MSARSLQNWRNGTSLPSVSRALDLCELLGYDDTRKIAKRTRPKRRAS